VAHPAEEDSIWISGARNAQAVADGTLRRVLEDALEETLRERSLTLRSLVEIGPNRTLIDGSVEYSVTIMTAPHTALSAKGDTSA
jgi:hypothetical protein